ncbi:MAG: M20/M25/M40 family metallo-hydrolase [Nostoc sp.]|uniref:M20/M25/M40 family metallo-hydrolase n=1 Tax=Nostoc sp. TaxID=1180 RepID=UPI002FEFEA5B
MKNKTINSLITILFIIFFVFIGIYQINPPNAVPTNVPLIEFSSGRAMKHLEVIAQKPHPIGSLQNIQVGNYITKQLTALGLDPKIQQTTAINSDGAVVIAGTVRNIFAFLKGTNNTKAILLVAHYDSVPNGLGASDDGAGVVAMLETARALKAGSPLKNDVIFLFTDGEESGLLGAEAFVNEYPWAKDIGVVFNFEARGNSGPAIMFETSSQNGWLIQEFAKAAIHPVANSLMYSIYKLLPNDTDLTVFKKAGLAGLNFAYMNGLVYYHSSSDNLDTIDERSLQHHGEYALALTRHFGKLRLENTQKSDAIYFDILGSVLVHYSEVWVIPLTGFVFLLFIWVVVFGLRKRLLSFTGITFGFLALLLSIVTTSVFVTITCWATYILHSEYRWLSQGDTYNSNLYLISFVSLTVAITSGLYVWLSKKVSIPNLTVGALLWWLLLMVLTSLYLPGASYLFTWPLLFSLVGLKFIFAAKPQNNLFLQSLILAVFAIPGIILFTPTIYLIFNTLTLNMSGLVMIFVVLLFGLLIPNLYLISITKKLLLSKYYSDKQVQKIDYSNQSHWLLPTISLLISLVFIVTGGLTAGFDANHPKQNSIFYAFNADTAKAIWASVDEQTDEWTSQFLATNTKKGNLSEYFPTSPRKVLLNQAPTIPLAAPNIKLLNDEVKASVRTLHMQISSPRQARIIRIYVYPSVQVLGAEVNGKQITNNSLEVVTKWWELYYFAPAKEGIELTLAVKSSQSLKLKVVDQLDGLPEIPGKTFKTRPKYMIPTAFAAGVSDSTLVSKYFTF